MKRNELTFPAEYLCTGTDMYTDMIDTSMRALREAISSKNTSYDIKAVCRTYPGLEYWLSAFWKVKKK